MVRAFVRRLVYIRLEQKEDAHLMCRIEWTREGERVERVRKEENKRVRERERDSVRVREWEKKKIREKERYCEWERVRLCDGGSERWVNHTSRDVRKWYLWDEFQGIRAMSRNAKYQRPMSITQKATYDVPYLKDFNVVKTSRTQKLLNRNPKSMKKSYFFLF